MSNDLTTQPSAADTIALLMENQQSKYADDKAIAQITSASSYLPYIQIMQSGASEVQQRKINMGVFALCKGKDKIELGDKLVCLLLSWRPKAMVYSPEVVSFFDPNSDAFKKVQVECEMPNSGKGCGPEFLLWLPERQEIVTFFFGNATGRVEGPNLITAIKKGKRNCRLDIHLITDKQKRSWYGARYNEYDLDITLPTADVLAPILSKFNSPPASSADVKEKADVTEDRG